MSEESAFLEALQADPADDTVRLVYADWLDEHAEPAKAEYLRLVATLAHATEDYAREQPHVSRLLALAETLPQEWRAQAGSRFKVVFYSQGDAAKKVSTIKAVRDVSGGGLAEAMAVIETGWPSELLARVPFEQSLLARDTVRETGATLYLHPFETTHRPIPVFYDLIASRQSTDLLDSAQSTECKAVFAAFLQKALNIGAVRARRLAESNRVTLAKHQDPVVAGVRARELWHHIEYGAGAADDYPDFGPAWGIWVSTIARTRPNNKQPG